MADDVVLTGPWSDLRTSGEPEREQIQAITKEALREIPPGHVLHGMAFTVVGRSHARDDVLLKIGSQWALVHLSWSGKPAVSPWPMCVIFKSASEVEQALALD